MGVIHPRTEEERGPRQRPQSPPTGVGGRSPQDLIRSVKVGTKDVLKRSTRESCFSVRAGLNGRDSRSVSIIEPKHFSELSPDEISKDTLVPSQLHPAEILESYRCILKS
jgi:hypothetical protein